MTVRQVKEARRRAWAGESARQIAAEMKLRYTAVWNAIVGVTWSSIGSPPPLPVGRLQRRRTKMNTCGNCGAQFRSDDENARGSSDRCHRCYQYRRRTGREWTQEQLRQWRHTRLSARQLARLYDQYAAGASIREIVERNQLPFAEETLRRRFVDAGFALRSNAGVNQKLTVALVRQARRLVNVERIPAYLVAERLNVNYHTLHSAVSGATWRAAGGALPETSEEKRPCRNCGLLTGHHSGLCRFCRKGVG
jgi:hypothetical protein